MPVTNATKFAKPDLRPFHCPHCDQVIDRQHLPELDSFHVSADACIFPVYNATRNRNEWAFADAQVYEVNDIEGPACPHCGERFDDAMDSSWATQNGDKL